MKTLVLSPLEKSIQTLIIATVLLSYSIIGAAQDTYVGDLNFSRQSEIDSFLIEHPVCSAVIGSITLNNSTNEIFSTAPFANLTYVSDDLNLLFEGQYFDLTGFIALDSIGDSLVMHEHDWWYSNQVPDSVFMGLSNIQSLGHFIFNGYLFGDANLFPLLPSLVSCNTITFTGSIYNTYSTPIEFNNSFNNLISVNSIRFMNIGGNASVYSHSNYYITDSFNSLTSATTIYFDFVTATITNSFTNIQSTQELTIGPSDLWLSAIAINGTTFSNLTTAGNINIRIDNFSLPDLPSLTHANSIFCESWAYPFGNSSTLFPSLEHINANAYFILKGPSIELPSLSAIGGDFMIIDLWNDGQSYLESIIAPQLTSIGGSINISSGPSLTTCESPAFCASSNYSPNWAAVSGGPGCSTVEEIQAQCEITTPNCEGDAFITTQAEWDLFAAENAGCISYVGDITIDNSLAEIDSLYGLDSVRTMVGDLAVDFAGYSFPFNGLNGLDSLAGDLNISNCPEYFSGFYNLRHAEDIVLTNTNLLHTIENDITRTAIENLVNCSTITFQYNIDNSSVNLYQYEIFNNLSQCRKIEVKQTDTAYSGGVLSNSFNNLTSIDTLNVKMYFLIIEHSFQTLPNINSLKLGADNHFIRSAHNSFCALNTAETLELRIDNIDGEAVPSLSNLTTVRDIWIEIFGSGNNTSFLGSLNNISGEAFIYLRRDTIAFDSLEHVRNLIILSNFGIGENPSISAIRLPLLSSVDEDLLIGFTPIDTFTDTSFCSFYAPQLTYVGEKISIEYVGLNTALTSINLSGLDYAQNLTFAFVQCNELHLPSSWSCGNIGIQNVQGLVSLNDISIVEPGYINITECSDFSVCSSPGLCEHISQYPERCFFANNAPGCSSIEEIQTQCLGSYASGTVYYDVDCDQQFNNDDALVSYPVLLQGDTLPIGSSGEAGYFFVPLELNNTTTLFAQHSADWSSNGPITLTTTDSLQVFTDLQIGLCPVIIIHDVAVNVNASMDPRPGFTVRYNVIAQNLWPGSDSASVVFSTAQMPNAVITGYSSGGTLEGNQVSFTTDLLYGQAQTLWVDVLVPVGTPLGTAYTATATIALNDAQAIDSHPENNNYTLAQTVIGSYDPNDKLVTPAVIDLLDIDSTQTATLEYTIRFQNTGTAEAFFVWVLDTLSSALNPATFELIATSHPSEITFHDNHIIEWFFDNIMLPDSFSNEPESHGFIQFRIQTLPLSEPATLENEAAIYFDFNEPVITPPAVTEVVICAEVGEACDDLDPCTINDLIQPDCSCAGTFADADSDGICDASEVAGCMDIEACNYNALATDDDGSCTYVESLNIEGETNPVASIEVSYTYPGPPTSNYQWAIYPGSIVSGQGTSTVSVIWTDDLLGTLQVTETNETDCVGETVVLEVNILPISISSLRPQSINLYPNPASDVLHIAGDIPSNAHASILNGLGQCVYLGTLASTIDVRALPAGVYYLRIQRNGTVESVKFTIVRE